MTYQRNMFSWNNIEDKREKLIMLTKAYKKADSDMEQHHSSDEILNITISNYKKNPNSSEVSKTLNDMLDFQDELVQNYGLNFHFVRKVICEVLNPHPEELRRCDENIKKEKLKFNVQYNPSI